jgi:hypothetical protein
METRRHNDVDGYAGPEIPEVAAHLQKHHGYGFMGFPLFRCVYSPYVLTYSAGEWHDWDSSIPPEIRGRMVMGNRGVPSPDNQEDRRILEMRLCPAYPELHATPGWILERWMAPAFWGTQDDWESRKVAGTDYPAFGPFPHNGKYLHIGGPYDEKPTGHFLDRLIEYWEAMRDEVLALACDAYVRKRTFEAEERDKERSEKWNRDASAANMTALLPYFSTSLEAGKARSMAAERAGLTSHYGA